jgi:hypothetical protein
MKRAPFCESKLIGSVASALGIIIKSAISTQRAECIFITPRQFECKFLLGIKFNYNVYHTALFEKHLLASGERARISNKAATDKAKDRRTAKRCAREK